MKKYVCHQVTLFGMMFVLLGTGCGEESLHGGFGGLNPNANQNLAGISEIQISPASLDMKGIGTTVGLNLIVRLNSGQVLTDVRESFVDPVDDSSHDVKWISDNKFVARFDGPGQLRAISAGETMIQAEVEEHIAEVPVTVTATLSLDPLDEEITIPLHVANIAISPGDLELLGPGDSISLGATLFYSDEFVQDSIRRYFVHPSGEVAGQIGWFSSNPSVATVSGYGIVQAKAPGETTITVYNPWTDIFPTDEITVTVGDTTL